MENLDNIRVEQDRLVIDEGSEIREIPLMALASYAELLGYSCPWETVDAILHIQDHGEPDYDPVTGENPWTDGFHLLAHRETARDQEYIQAEEEGTAEDPRSPLLRSAVAAYNAVHQKINDGDCAMDRCRGVARERLGVDPPTRNAGTGSRLVTTSLSTRRVMAKDERQTLIEDAVSPHLEEVVEMREEFLSSLSPVARNPFAPPKPEPAPRDVAQETLRKYGGGDS